MRKPPYRLSARLPLAAATLIVGVAATPVQATDLDSGYSCISGDVPAYDYAEIDANFRETMWDRSAGVRIVSSTTQMELTVIDTSGSTVCEETADMKTRCSFKLRTGDVFTIRIDNTPFDQSSRYKLCAF